jgi:hypothetical protein
VNTRISQQQLLIAAGYLKFSAFVWIWILLYGGSEPTALSVSKAKALLK